jgi:hypothetical protein
VFIDGGVLAAHGVMNRSEACLRLAVIALWRCNEVAL